MYLDSCTTNDLLVDCLQVCILLLCEKVEL